MQKSILFKHNNPQKFDVVNYNQDSFINPKTSSYWDLNYIYIDDSGSNGNGTWLWAESQSWCNGSGTIIDPYIIENITIDGTGRDFCIKIENSNKYFEIRNSTLFNSNTQGIYLNTVSNGRIINNTIYDITGNGIELYWTSSNFIIKDNIIINCYFGIYAYYQANNNIIYNNSFINHYRGIFLNSQCNSNNISKNLFKYNGRQSVNNYAIRIASATSNTIADNYFISNPGRGIVVESSISHTISGNLFYNNTYYGIHFDDSDDSWIFKNEIYNNSYGIRFDGSIGSDDNYIFENNIANNPIRGIHIEDGIGNYIYNNSFSGVETYHGYDLRWKSYWNNSIIGNYWEDYSGSDFNDDGVGDTPYTVRGMKLNYDYKPIWSDGPTIIINNPSPDEIFGSNLQPPDYNIETNDPLLDSLWYTLNIDPTIFMILSNNTINTTVWSGLLDGNITINFYGNETNGAINNNQVTVIKDIIPPNISIFQPFNSAFFNLSSPFYNISLQDLTLDKVWYTLDNGLNNYTITNFTDFINSNAWINHIDGLVSMKFYANDTQGKESYGEILVIKDTIKPIIMIQSPKQYTNFSAEPSFTIAINDENLDTLWFTIGSSNVKYMFSGNGTIGSTVWNSLSAGMLIIIFFANDSAGNIGFTQITIYKNSPVDSNNYLLIISLIGIFSIALTTIVISKKHKRKKARMKDQEDKHIMDKLESISRE
jgi:parallel beta-helix repeat protein